MLFLHNEEAKEIPGIKYEDSSCKLSSFRDFSRVLEKLTKNCNLDDLCRFEKQLNQSVESKSSIDTSEAEKDVKFRDEL